MNKSKKARAYINKLLSQGAKEIKISWEGGNDEGSFYLYVDDQPAMIDWDRKNDAYNLIDFIGDQMGYGSFAGDFYVNGEAIYDKEEGAFIGSDDYEELTDFTYYFKEPLTIRIPKDLWFDSIDLNVSGYTDELDADVKLLIMNGPVVEDHVKFEERTAERLRLKVEEIFKEMDYINSVWHNVEITRDQLPVDKDGNPFLLIHNVTYSKYQGEEKEIRIQL